MAQKLEQTILLCHLEIDLMLAMAKQHYAPADKEDATLDLVAIDIGLTLGNQNIGLSSTMREILDNIKLLDKRVYESFVYAYNGSLGVHGHDPFLVA
ncbi:hypothetical protein [Vibrio anguillarum]|uniref:Uncharacterized protein n=1 Tax=Vibrio anguillarum TaxID=55601 RepID=A0A7U6J3M2_VIBAN|nr:hypothetical protein [Vibrio anguillarum]AZS26268.1 hypothetical protein DYL72_15275 [Vibrio anguillarum]MBF4374549.1 hypothetical protein [Vibrio anguillarum]